MENIQGFIEQGGPLAPLVYIGFKSLTYIIAPLSAGPIVMLSGTIFGPWLGTLYSMIGDLIGGSVNFWIAALLGRSIVIKLTGKKGLQKVDEFYESVGEWKGLLVTRFVLHGFYDFVSYAAGLTKLKFRTYVWVSLVGGILPTFYAVFVGSTLIANRGVFFSMIGVTLILILLMLYLQHKEEQKKTTSE